MTISHTPPGAEVTTGISVAPRTVLGYTSRGPIYVQAGGSGDGDGGGGADPAAAAGDTTTTTAGAAGDGGTDTGQPPTTTSTTTAAASPAGPADASGSTQQPAATAGERIEDLPDWAQKHIKRLAKSDGDNRIASKKAKDEATAAAAARDELVVALGRLLGTEPAADQTPPDPAKLTEQLQTATGQHRDALVRLAVWEQGSDLGANVGELMDSAQFLKSIAGLDPAADDFDELLGQKVAAMVEANPNRFKAPARAAEPPVTAPSGASFTGGPGGSNKTDPSVDDFRDSYRKSRPT